MRGWGRSCCLSGPSPSFPRWCPLAHPCFHVVIVNVPVGGFDLDPVFHHGPYSVPPDSPLNKPSSLQVGHDYLGTGGSVQHKVARDTLLPREPTPHVLSRAAIHEEFTNQRRLFCIHFVGGKELREACGPQRGNFRRVKTESNWLAPFHAQRNLRLSLCECAFVL